MTNMFLSPTIANELLSVSRTHRTPRLVVTDVDEWAG